MSDGRLLTVKLDFVATCPNCRRPRAVKASGKCPECDIDLPAEDVAAVRSAVRSRRQAFKVRLGRLAGRMHTATDRPLAFITRGVPANRIDYLNKVMRPAIGMIEERHQLVAKLLAQSEWRLTNADCIKTFTELVRVLDAEIDFVAQLTQIMPPLELRGVHREMARAAAQFVRSHVFMAQTLCAVDADEAAELGVSATNAMTTAQKHLARATDLFRLIKRSPSPDPFRTNGSLDIAALAWSTVNLKATTIKGAASQVRSAFADLPDVPHLADHYASLLLPMLAVGAGIVDPETLALRVQQLRSIIDGVGSSSIWLVDPELLVSRVLRGVERFAEETERLGLESKHGLPRHHVMRSETEVYRTLVEGALRDLGGVVLVAARAGRGDDDGTYEIGVVDGIKAGEIVSELDGMGAPFGRAIDMLYRNASAHADVEITDTGIIVIERRIVQGREVFRDPQSRTDAEFAEDMVALQEILIAMELVILPWLWFTTDSRLAAAVKRAPVTKRQRDNTIALLGGIAGLYNLSVSTDSDNVIITAAAHEDSTDRRESKVLTVVPAAFGLYPDILHVSLHVARFRPVTFDRVEFLESESDDLPHKLPMLGLTMARWMLESGWSWSERDEATYIIFQLAALHFACCRIAGSAPPRTENIDQAVNSLRLVLSRLDEVLPAERRSQPTRQAVELATTLASSLEGVAESRRGQRSPVEGERLGKVAAATLQPMQEIQADAEALRDSNP